MLMMANQVVDLCLVFAFSRFSLRVTHWRAKLRHRKSGMGLAPPIMTTVARSNKNWTQGVARGWHGHTGASLQQARGKPSKRKTKQAEQPLSSFLFVRAANNISNVAHENVSCSTESSTSKRYCKKSRENSGSFAIETAL